MLNGDLADSNLASHDDVRNALYADDFYEDKTTEQIHERMEHEAFLASASKLLSVVVAVVVWCRSGTTPRQIVERLEIAMWAFGCEKSCMSMAELGRSFAPAKTRASISNTVLSLQKSIGIPESIGQKMIAARAAYWEARQRNLKK